MSESTALERIPASRTTALDLADERVQRSIEFQARALAALDKRIADIKDNDERKRVAVGLAITLYNYGLPITPTNGKKFHLIGGEWTESAQLLLGLLAMHGHDVRVIEEDDDHATLRGLRFGRGEPHIVTYTIEQARRSHALDEWVERWESTQNGKRFLAEKFVISVDGEATCKPEDIPDWARKEITARKVKKNEAWFSYRSDMLINRGARRMAKRIGADALLGVGPGMVDEDELVAQGEVDSQDDAFAGRSGDHDERDDDGAITDAEIVEEPTASEAPTAKRPAAKDDPTRPFTDD